MNRPDRSEESFLDGAGARLCALAVLAGAVAVIAWHHRNDLFPPDAEPQATLNPDFVKCRDERTAQVDKMHSDGVISQEQHGQFTGRAIAFCTDRFPPDQ